MTFFLVGLGCFIAGLIAYRPLIRLVLKALLFVGKKIDNGAGDLHQLIAEAEDALKK